MEQAQKQIKIWEKAISAVAFNLFASQIPKFVINLPLVALEDLVRPFSGGLVHLNGPCAFLAENG